MTSSACPSRLIHGFRMTGVTYLTRSLAQKSLCRHFVVAEADIEVVFVVQRSVAMRRLSGPCRTIVVIPGAGCSVTQHHVLFIPGSRYDQKRVDDTSLKTLQDVGSDGCNEASDGGNTQHGRNSK